MRYLARDRAPAADGRRCLNYRFSGYCQNCAAICPHDALDCSGSVTVDESRCSGCGICAAACPTRCLKMPEPQWEAVLAKALKQPEPCFGCRRLTGGEANVFIPCLGGLPAEFLAALFLLRGQAIGLDVSACSECKQKKAWRQLTRTLFKAKKMTGGHLKIKALWGAKQAKDGSSSVRRESLAGVGHNLKDLSGSIVTAMIPGGLSGDEQAASEISPEKVTFPRTLLLKALGSKRSGVLVLDTYKVKAGCSGCGYCQALCPQKAWELQYTGSEASLNHYPLRCSGCGLCAARCPRQAKVKNTVRWNEAFDSSLPACVFPAVQCAGCAEPLLESAKRVQYCPSCVKREELQSSITLAAFSGLN